MSPPYSGWTLLLFHTSSHSPLSQFLWKALWISDIIADQEKRSGYTLGGYKAWNLWWPECQFSSFSRSVFSNPLHCSCDISGQHFCEPWCEKMWRSSQSWSVLGLWDWGVNISSVHRQTCNSFAAYQSARAGGGNGNPLQYSFLPGESHGQGSLAGYSPWGRKESDMIEQLTLHSSFYFSIHD